MKKHKNDIKLSKRIKGKRFPIFLGIMTFIIILLQLWSASLNVELSTSQYVNLLKQMEILERGDLVNNRMVEITKETELLTMRMVADEYFDFGLNRTEFQEQYIATIEENLEIIELMNQILDERDDLITNLYKNFTKEHENLMLVNHVDAATSKITFGFLLILLVYVIIHYVYVNEDLTSEESIDKDKKANASKKKIKKKKSVEKKK